MKAQAKETSSFCILTTCYLPQAVAGSNLDNPKEVTFMSLPDFPS